MLPCRFIEERWHWGASARLLRPGGDAQPLGSPGRAGCRGGCFIPGCLIWDCVPCCWALLQGQLRAVVVGGEGTCAQILHPALSLQRGCHALGPGEGEEWGGQAIRVRSDPCMGDPEKGF